MATGRDRQLARHVGEHLVAAELGRRGYVATPFAGNVPMFDLLAADVEGFAIPLPTFAWLLATRAYTREAARHVFWAL
jgi:hypothetical protein